MAILTIKGKDYEGKCTFKFDRLADSKYNEADANGNETGGFMSLYMHLLQSSTKHLPAFWDCALEYLKKEKPSLEDIEEALEQRIEEDGDADQLFREAFKAVDESGFYKKQAKSFWKNLEMMKESGVTDEEKADNLKMYNMMVDARNELTE
ncbi:tail assembly chaperone [Sporosarcina sp. SAFN-010]|uniref:tail assembly chaperone n=1 Tax=Sporosarcina sp. SAFN-010 TaxID=3387273 RepID=UPI003F807469